MDEMRKRFQFANGSYMDAVGSSGGLALFWREGISLTISGTNKYSISVILHDYHASIDWYITFCYGEPNPQFRPQFWHTLHACGDTFKGPWLVIGDFNAILSGTDKIGGRTLTSRQTEPFSDFMTRYSMVELPCAGSSLTWLEQ